ncbi:MAG: hypothetical protein JRI43_08860, partial [Deltaproteobacteria bacterium]|nr:hypothetical protein [Deltaproteobacteria bacterium]
EHLENIKRRFGEKAEIIAYSALKHESGQYDSRVTTVLEMAKRRPVRAVDITDVLNITLVEVESLIKGLLIKGRIKKQEHAGETFYISE